MTSCGFVLIRSERKKKENCSFVVAAGLLSLPSFVLHIIKKKKRKRIADITIVNHFPPLSLPPLLHPERLLPPPAPECRVIEIKEKEVSVVVVWVEEQESFQTNKSYNNN